MNNFKIIDDEWAKKEFVKSFMEEYSYYYYNPNKDCYEHLEVKTISEQPPEAISFR